ncbi:MAG: hypothetical protein VXZ40_00660 [Nanoarchaeota archaeon]|nr:hypothetical protein [Nanoarchaeota archaeon]
MSKTGFKFKQQKQQLEKFLKALGIEDASIQNTNSTAVAFSPSYSVDITCPSSGKGIIRDHYKPHVLSEGNITGDLDNFSSFLYDIEPQR